MTTAPARLEPQPPIPGIIPDLLPDDITAKLASTNIKTRRQLAAAEAENVRRPVLKYLVDRPTKQSAPFDLPWLTKLHAEMFAKVWHSAGTLRTSEAPKDEPHAAAPNEIETALQNTLDALAGWKQTGMTLLEQSVRLHHAAARIRPFEGGNVRWSRFLGNIWLRRHNHPIVEWPPVPPGSPAGPVSPIRQTYLTAVRAADNHNIAPLLELHRRFLAREPR